MGYFSQFDTFNPITGALSHTFTYLPAIAQRARELLRGRTVEQVKFAAEGIDWAIDEFFADEVKARHQEVSQLTTHEMARIVTTMNEPRRWKRDDTSEYNEAEKYCCFQSDGEGSGEWIFDSSKQDVLEQHIEESLGIPNSDNTDELTALKFCLEIWDDAEIAGPDFPNAKSFELFAVLALWKLAEAMARLRNDPPKCSVDELDAIQEFEEVKEKFMVALSGDRDFNIRFKMSYAAKSALQAMDAVGYAEHLFTLKQVKDKQTHILTEQKEQARSQRSMAAIKLNIARHKKTNATKARVLENWAEQPDKFSSAEKAGRYFADELQKKGLIFEPRTVTGWIRRHAKEIGVRLR